MDNWEIQIGPQEALISAITQGGRDVSFLIGSPLSMPDYPKGPGVPGVQGIQEIILEHVRKSNLEEEYKTYICNCGSGVGYQKAFSFILSWLGQDAVNKIVETAVLRARVKEFSQGKEINPDLDVDSWYLPRGIRSLGEIIAKHPQFQGPILTTNFDPLLAIAVKAGGGEPIQTVLHVDGSLGDHRALSERHRHVIHLHGYWRNSDTLHTPDQLTSQRPRLKASLSRLLSEKRLVVIGYGGWDDIFIAALRELMDDERSPLDVLWAFRENDTQTITNKYNRLLDKVGPARTRGRFRLYGGIECNQFFASLASRLSSRDNQKTTSPIVTRKAQVDLNSPPNNDLSVSENSSTPHNVSPILPISEVLSGHAEDSLIADIDMFEEWRPHYTEAHLHVRAVEQAQFLEIIESDRVVFVSADWGLGKDGFIAAAKTVDKSPLSDAKFYRLDLEGVADRETLLATAEAQFGSPLQVFAIAASKLDSVALILDGVGIDSCSGDDKSWPNALSEVVSALVDFVPSLRVILIGRREICGYKFPSVQLSPLDEPDTRTYIENHPEGGVGLIFGDTFDALFRLSRGVPMQLDRLLSELSVISIDELLESEVGSFHETNEIIETIPVALERAVRNLSGSDLDHQKRSNYLLKILSVLAHGEPFANIKRFDNSKPFYPSQIRELRDLGLLESTSVLSSLPMPGSHSITKVSREAASKIHTVPPQVREYITARLTTEEINSIVSRATEITFGPEWRQGTIKLSMAAKEHLRDHTRSGPGNAHLLIVHQLRQAIECEDETSLQITLKLGSNYCSLLKDNDRYRDLVSAAKEILLLSGSEVPVSSTSMIRKLYGQGLRMIGRHEEAIAELELALTQIEEHVKSTKSEIYLSLALAYQSNGDMLAASKAAKDVQKLEDPGSSKYLHAATILIECEEKDDTEESLRKIERRARKKGSYVVANNITIDLAGKENDYNKKISLYDKVIRCNEDKYNQMRAIVKKGKILVNNLRLSELRNDEHRLLNKTYGFSFTQRFKSLFDDSHQVLWALLEANDDRSGLFQLFRYSSLIWRLRGDSSKEQHYAEMLRGFLAGESGYKEEASLTSQIIRYVRIRIRLIAAGGVSSGVGPS